MLVIACAGCATDKASEAPSHPSPEKQADPSAHFDWLGYPFDLRAVDHLTPGASLDDVKRALGGDPVARHVYSNGDHAYIWYHDSTDGLDAVELKFRNDRFVECGDRVSMASDDVRYSDVPAALDAFEWGRYSETGKLDKDALLLRPGGEVYLGYAYDHAALSKLVDGESKVSDAVRILGGTPVWVAGYSDGTTSACWRQATPRRGTMLVLEFDANGLLARCSPNSIIFSAIPPPSEAGRDGARRTFYMKLFEVSPQRR